MENSAQLTAFAQKFARLKDCINPDDITSKCYSAGLFSADERDVINEAGTRARKATELLRAVEVSIRKDSASFKKFTLILESDSTCKQLARELGETCPHYPAVIYLYSIYRRCSQD